MYYKRTQRSTAPLWMVTYGDMMGLLLCVFVVLVSMSEVKKNRKFDRIAGALREAFGSAQAASITGDSFTTKDAILRQVGSDLLITEDLTIGQVLQRGVKSGLYDAQSVKDGWRILLTGETVNQTEDQRLSSMMTDRLRPLSRDLFNFDNVIYVWCNATKAAQTSTDHNHDLEFQAWSKGKSIRDFLIGQGLDGRRIKVGTTLCSSSSEVDTDGVEIFISEDRFFPETKTVENN